MNDEGWVYCPFCDHRTPDMQTMCCHLLAKHRGDRGLPPELYGLAMSSKVVSCWCADRFYFGVDQPHLGDDWIHHLTTEGGPTAHILKLLFKE